MRQTSFNKIEASKELKEAKHSLRFWKERLNDRYLIEREKKEVIENILFAEKIIAYLEDLISTMREWYRLTPQEYEQFIKGELKLNESC